MSKEFNSNLCKYRKNEDIFDYKLLFDKSFVDWDGPILSLYKTDNGVPFIVLWVDCDEKRDRYLVFEVTSNIVNLYENSHLSLHDMIFSAKDGNVYFFDLITNNKQDVLNNYMKNMNELLKIKKSSEHSPVAYSLTIKNLPTVYLPEKRSYYIHGDTNSTRRGFFDRKTGKKIFKWGHDAK